MAMQPLAPLRRVKSILRQTGHDVLDLLLPARCQLCDAPARPEHDRALCEQCGADWPRLEPGCPCCGQPGAGPDVLCVRCAAESPAFDHARALTLYEGKAAEAIQALKYHGRRGLAPLLGRWMAEALAGQDGSLFPDAPRYQAVVPIPLHWRRRWWRGYNQAELLAVHIAGSLDAPLELEIGRGRSASRQAQLGQRERRDNTARAFTVSAAAARRLNGAAVLLVDDVFTTGATTGACASSLKAAGARRVDVLTLARTP